MRFRAVLYVCLVGSFLAGFSLTTLAQETPTPPAKDPLAASLLQQAVRAMGGSVPNDAVSLGTITITAGGATESGQFKCLQRGTNQAVEEVETREGRKQTRYSKGVGAQSDGLETKTSSGELGVSSRPACSPLSLIAEALSDADISIQYVARETLEGRDAHHIRFWRVYTNPRLKHLSEYSTRDIWLDGTTGLPLKVSYWISEAVGAPRIAVEFAYSDYANSGGVLFPRTIHKKFNGTPYATILIHTVNVNSGVSEAAFRLR